MDIISRTIASIRQQGLWVTMVKVGVFVADYIFDMHYGVDTSSPLRLENLTVQGDNKERSLEHFYQPTRVLLLRKLFSAIEPLLPENRVLVDFGCGKGRVLLIASQFGFREARGVEFAYELCRIARNNCITYQARTSTGSRFRIIDGDVVQYPVNRDETVFFMFNPFDETIMKQVLDNISASLRERQRKILIIYHNPRYRSIIEQRPDFMTLQDLNIWGHRFMLYSNTAVPASSAPEKIALSA